MKDQCSGDDCFDSLKDLCRPDDYCVPEENFLCGFGAIPRRPTGLIVCWDALARFCALNTAIVVNWTILAAR